MQHILKYGTAGSHLSVSKREINGSATAINPTKTGFII